MIGSPLPAAEPPDELLLPPEMHFRAMFEQFPLSIQIFSPAGRTLQVNRAWRELFGLTLEDAANFNPLKDPQLAPVREYIRRGFSGEILEVPPALFERGQHHSSGRKLEPFWVKAFICPVRDAGGEIREVIVVHQDVNDLKQSEEELLRAKTELEQRVLERTQALAHANAALLAEIEKHQETEAALTRGEQYFRTVTENASDIVTIVSTEGITTYNSPSVRRILGYEPEELDRTSPFELIHPDDLVKTQEAFQRLLNNPGRVEIAEYRLRHKDGSYRFLEGSGRTLPSDSAVEGVIVHARDISGRREAEAALRESERRYQLVAQQTGQLLYDYNVETSEIRWLGPIAAVTGYSQEEFCCGLRGWIALLHPEDRETALSELAEAQKTGGEYHTGYRLRRKDGSYMFIEDDGVFMIAEDGQGVRMLGTLKDVTARRQREFEEQKRIEKMLYYQQTLLELAQTSHSAFDEELGRMLRKDAETIGVERVSLWCTSDDKTAIVRRQMFLLSEGRFDPAEVKLRESDFPSYFDAIKSGWNLIVADDARTDTCTSEFTATYLDPLGITSMLDAPVFLNGRLVGVLCHEHVGPARKWSQEEVDFGRSIAQMVALALETAERRSAEEALRAAKEAADSANRAKSQFLANMSHELRTPLNAILGYTQILRRENQLTEKQRQGVDTIEQSGEHLLALINDILDLSKVEARRMELHPADFDLQSFLSDIRSIFALRAREKKISYTEEIDSNLPEVVQLDDQRLRQVLFNLIGNAVKFTNQGGVRFSVRREGEQMLFSIEDTGIGIPPAELQKIFDPFHRGAGSVQAIEGTGLGLAITKSLLEIMGSRLHVESKLGSGSRFWFQLHAPASAASIPAKALRPEKITGYRGERRHILVVDDNRANRLVMVNMLAPIGFEVSEAESGDDCLAQLTQLRPHMILMDLRMPGTDGLEATRLIRKSEQLPQPRIVAISASAYESNHNECIEAGCDDFLAKPFREEELLRLLGQLLDLEWQHAETASAQEEPREMIPPAPEEAAQILLLARRGDILRIRERAAALLEDKEHEQFARRLLQLADQFKVKAIRELVEPHAAAEQP